MTGTARAGLYVGALALFINVGLSLAAINICAPVSAVIFGLAAGILAVRWTDGSEEELSPTSLGAKAGAIVGVGAFIGLAVGMTVWFSYLGGRQETISLANSFVEEELLSLPENTTMSELSRYYLMSATCCFGGGSLFVSALTGAIAAKFFYEGQRERP